MGAPHFLERRAELCRGNVLLRQKGAGRRALFLWQREQQVLGRDVGIAEFLGLRVGTIEYPVELAAEGRLRPAALLSREAGELTLHAL